MAVVTAVVGAAVGTRVVVTGAGTAVVAAAMTVVTGAVVAADVEVWGAGEVQPAKSAARRSSTAAILMSAIGFLVLVDMVCFRSFTNN